MITPELAFNFSQEEKLLLHFNALCVIDPLVLITTNSVILFYCSIVY